MRPGTGIALYLQQTSAEHLLHSLQSDGQRSAPTRQDNIVSGPAIIFHRYHEKDIAKIRGEETCRSIVGYDVNALYLWALMQDMPTGWYTRRREERKFRPQQTQPFGQMAVQWLTWEAAKNGCAIRHQVNFQSTGGVRKHALHIHFTAVSFMVVRNATTKM